VTVDDPLWAEIAQIERTLRARGDYLYLGWNLSRRYTREELDAAQAFRLIFTRVFEPPGELCGTVYDESTACSFCGAGRTQVSELVLELGRAPNTDLAVTIAGEYVVSGRLAAILVAANVGGIELEPVRDARESARAPRSPKYQLTVVDEVPVAAATRFGRDLVDPDSPDSDRCPLGHVVGLNVLSEVYVPQAALADADIVATNELVGRREGVLVPEPLILVSPRVRRLLLEEGASGWEVERAHLV
jgi:hypothetical protein